MAGRSPLANTRTNTRKGPGRGRPHFQVGRLPDRPAPPNVEKIFAVEIKLWPTADSEKVPGDP